MTLLNIYKIENLNEIKWEYRLFKVRGISPLSEDFEKNAQLLSDRLSRMTRSPCIKLREDEQLFVAQPIGCLEPPERVPLVGTEAIIKAVETTKIIDCGKITDQEMPIAVRFLQFHLDGQLHNVKSLWRPSAGMPYFHKQSDPSFKSEDVVMYRGFKFRVIPLPHMEIGICVDVTRKYASRYYLPPKIQPDQFRKYKGKNAIYEFGHRWYEISIDGISDLNVSEVPVGNSSLYEYIHDKTKGQKPPALLTLPRDCTVLTYKTSLGFVRHMPSALCRLTYTTDHPAVSKYHSKTIIPPHKRKEEIEFIVKQYFSGWEFQGIPINLSSNMLEMDCDVLELPDLEFGGGKILSLKQISNTVYSTLDDFSYLKKRLLYSTDAGFFVKKPLDRQYLVMPKSMYETYGEKYIEDLKEQFRRLYSPDGAFQYDPVIITYDDSVRQSIYILGNEIINSVMQTISNSFFYSGYGIVIIPRLRSKKPYKEDELANLLMCEFRKRGIHVSVTHTEIPFLSYVQSEAQNGQPWQIVQDEKVMKRFRGYLEMVVLNKILLLNRCWPFVLSKPLNSDLIIGFDVKNNTAGFMLMFKDGRTFSFRTSDSDQSEQLGRGHVFTVICKYLKDELEGYPYKIQKITVHRDGKLYDGEKRGIKEALDRLAEEGFIEKDYDCNFVEIKKTSKIPMRFFEKVIPEGSMYERIENPKIGTYKIFGNTAFMCTTGQPYKYRGTTKPIQISKVEGNMDFKLILEDIFAAANLTWTKPDYCSRLPITIKMTDIRLREWAGEYDEDKLKFLEEESEE